MKNINTNGENEMNYREALNTLNCKASFDMDTITKEYRKLLIQSHPDHGGTPQWFQSVREAYKIVLSNYKYQKNVKDEETGEWSSEDVNLTKELQEKMIEIFEKVSAGIEIDIAIMGTWIWISGNTFDCKNTLKTIGFKFSRNKTAWYWYHGEYKKRSNKNFSLDDIAEMHGKMDVERKKPRLLKAAA